TSNEIPRITFGGDWNYEISSRWVDDGSFVKIQNVRLQYTLPSSLLESLPISNAKIYVSGNNLHYFTKYDGNFRSKPVKIYVSGNNLHYFTKYDGLTPGISGVSPSYFV